MDCEQEAGMHREPTDCSKLAFRQMLASQEGQGRDRAVKELRTAVDFEPGDSNR